eukprot:11226206-Lingulodinium_polyedra.AAC.1
MGCSDNLRSPTSGGSVLHSGLRPGHRGLPPWRRSRPLLRVERFRPREAGPRAAASARASSKEATPRL